MDALRARIGATEESLVEVSLCPDQTDNFNGNISFFDFDVLIS